MSKEYSALVTRISSRLCAIPLDCVNETMRPLPLQTVGKAPAFVLGVSVIRGLPTPIVDMARLIENRDVPSTRWVTIRQQDEQLALAVSETVGIFELDPSKFHYVPPLLGEHHQSLIESRSFNSFARHADFK
jgi:purine-binding chemotaxis protein CheW